ncbi:MAG TPA: (2Fe-2S)-binding protein [Spirochaetia bacterium]|nr:(2Fe-2S)-binding protein [Spirochaetia bacterium]
MAEAISFILNGKPVSFVSDPLSRLLDVLREEFRQTGVKEGCGQGECGACLVLVDGKAINSCLVPVGMVEGKTILTIEGYRETDRYRALSEALEEAGSVQCGFCTPGFVMAAEALLSHNPQPEQEAIREAISGNLCRCTGYNMIVEGIRLAARKGRGLW